MKYYLQALSVTITDIMQRSDYEFRHAIWTKIICAVSTPILYVVYNRVGRLQYSVCSHRASRYKYIRHHCTSHCWRYNHDRYNTAAAYFLYIICTYIGIRFFSSRRRRDEGRRTTSRSRRVVLDDRIAYIILYTHHYAW